MIQSKVDWYIEENQRLTLEIEHATREIHRLNHALTLQINRNKHLQEILYTHTAYAVGERGEACLSIDCGNL